MAATPERTATTDRPRWLPVAGLGLALFMATLDMTIVAVALPVIGRALAPPIAALLFLVAGTNLLYFLIPYFLQDVGQHRPAITGAVLLALPASMAATSLLVNVLAGTVADRLGLRRMTLGGATVVIAGEVLLLPLNADARPASVAPIARGSGAAEGLRAAGP
jgi:MFS family permease